MTAWWKVSGGQHSSRENQDHEEQKEEGTGPEEEPENYQRAQSCDAGPERSAEYEEEAP